MTEMTIEVRDSLAPKFQSFGGWLPTIVELAAANSKTSTPQKASDVIGEKARILVRSIRKQKILVYFSIREHKFGRNIFSFWKAEKSNL